MISTCSRRLAIPALASEKNGGPVDDRDLATLLDVSAQRGYRRATHMAAERVEYAR